MYAVAVDCSMLILFAQLAQGVESAKAMPPLSSALHFGVETRKGELVK